MLSKRNIYISKLDNLETGTYNDNDYINHNNITKLISITSKTIMIIIIIIIIIIFILSFYI